jgi:hypothetical protein
MPRTIPTAVTLRTATFAMVALALAACGDPTGPRPTPDAGPASQLRIGAQGGGNVGGGVENGRGPAAQGGGISGGVEKGSNDVSSEGGLSGGGVDGPSNQRAQAGTGADIEA